MAIDNLNYYSSGLPAGQQTDKYSSQPGCLKSKNLDIFSSSKSVKATAFSAPENVDLSGVVLVDQTGNLILKDNDNVYDISSGTEVLVKEGVSTNFPTYNKISYNGGVGTYSAAQRGTPKQLISKYENGVLKNFIIFTDRSKYTYSTIDYDNENSDITFSSSYISKISDDTFKITNPTSRPYIDMTFKALKGFTKAKLAILADNANTSQSNLTLYSVVIDNGKYYYNAELDRIVYRNSDGVSNIPFTDQLDQTTGKTIRIEIPLAPDSGDSWHIRVTFNLDYAPGTSDRVWTSGSIYMWFQDYWQFYNYLPLSPNRYLEDIGEYYWEKKTSFQPLYTWTEEWSNDDNYARVVRYSLDEYMGWESDVSMDVIGMVVWNEQVYMIGNMNGNGYIIPCDLTGTRGTPYIAYGCVFKGVTNIDYLLYLVGEDRGISTLWVFNQQELVPVIGGNKESGNSDIVGTDEQYKFDGRILNWRRNLILTTTDNRIFQYGQTYGGKGGSFIHQLPANAVIKDLKINGNNLEVSYSITANNVTTNYKTTYQDDISIKNYNTEWEAVYPIVLGNHLIEKEETDLYTSFILPSSLTSLEFWGMANHYHFWTFTSEDNATLDSTVEYKLKGATGNYALKFIERNENQYTFRLEGDLPVQNGNQMKITNAQGVDVITYSDFNHFRKIGTITTDKYLEGEFRFHNLNNKLELPKSYSLQIMVKGKGTANYTPELFALDLVANQRERG